MANLTTYAANAILNGTGLPASLYVQKHTANPTDTGTVAIAAGTSRKLITRSAAAGGVTSNTASITWVPYTVNETISHVSVWDDPDPGEGNCWAVGALPAPVAVVINDAVYFAVGALDIQLEIYP